MIFPVCGGNTILVTSMAALKDSRELSTYGLLDRSVCSPALHVIPVVTLSASSLDHSLASKSSLTLLIPRDNNLRY